MKKTLCLVVLCAALGACSTIATSPRDQVAREFERFGFSQERSSCLADALDDRLDGDDLGDVANFMSGLNTGETSPGGLLDALLNIDNARAAGAITRASLSCALG